MYNTYSCTDISDKKSNTRLVDHLKSDDCFGARTYPSARLEITQVQHKEGINYTITGNLTRQVSASNIGTFACHTFPRDTKASKRANSANEKLGIVSIRMELGLDLILYKSMWDN